MYTTNSLPLSFTERHATVEYDLADTVFRQWEKDKGIKVSACSYACERAQGAIAELAERLEEEMKELKSQVPVTDNGVVSLTGNNGVVFDIGVVALTEEDIERFEEYHVSGLMGREPIGVINRRMERLEDRLEYIKEVLVEAPKASDDSRRPDTPDSDLHADEMLPCLQAEQREPKAVFTSVCEPPEPKMTGPSWLTDPEKEANHQTISLLSQPRRCRRSLELHLTEEELRDAMTKDWTCQGLAADETCTTFPVEGTYPGIKCWCSECESNMALVTAAESIFDANTRKKSREAVHVISELVESSTDKLFMKKVKYYTGCAEFLRMKGLQRSAEQAHIHRKARDSETRVKG